MGERLEEIENTRKIVKQGLEMIRDRRESVVRLERDRDELVGTYVGTLPDVLEGLEAEERHRIYRMLRLEVFVGADGSLTVSDITDPGGPRTLGRDYHPDVF